MLSLVLVRVGVNQVARSLTVAAAVEQWFETLRLSVKTIADNWGAHTATNEAETILGEEDMAIEPLSVCVIRDGKICYVLPQDLTLAELREVEERKISAEARKRFGEQIASLSCAERKLWWQARAVIARNSKEAKKRMDEE